MHVCMQVPKTDPCSYAKPHQQPSVYKIDFIEYLLYHSVIVNGAT